MTSTRLIRVRFAPSPTGMMHLGNVRAALMNYLFAQQKQGTFILRIEDTDQERNCDPNAKKIIEDLLWLGLDYQEGPIKGGHYEPYFQSQRTDIYREKLTILQHKNSTYRCFCTIEELEKKRQRQLALKQPPRYDRTCMHLSEQAIEQKLAEKVPFIWRFKLDQGSQVTITDLARGQITFDFSNFSDFALTRADGSFTFMFANFVDDMTMVISHVIRGEDHLTNTAGQAALYVAFGIDLPIFWHLPIIGNAQGQKLSKRDFGFSLDDLQKAGYLPEAVCNYLAIIGGGSFPEEIMDMNTLAHAINFDALHATGQIRYDIEKLRWLNHKWIERLPVSDLAQRSIPFMQAEYPKASLSVHDLERALTILKTDCTTLADVPKVLTFVISAPVVEKYLLLQEMSAQEFEAITAAITLHSALLEKPIDFMSALKATAKEQKLPNKALFMYLRLALTGSAHGPALHDIIELLGAEKALRRLQAIK